MNFVLLVHPVRTGGPEAVHQLADTLCSLGHNSYILYAEEKRGALRAANVHTNKYPEYEGIQVIEAYDQLIDSVFILPEIWAHHALELAQKNIVLVWWLSVDNGLFSLGRSGFNLDHYRSHPWILHAYQSAYAKGFLESLGLNKHDLSLSDYTRVSSSNLGIKCRQANQPIRICFNPSKGAWLASLFNAYHPEVNLLPIDGMSPDQVRKALADADAYVEFGQLPGKDRLPREALVAGTRIFIRLDGAGAYDSDWHLPESSYFNITDCMSGALMNAIRAALNSDTYLWQTACQKVECERDIFHIECMRLADTIKQIACKPDIYLAMKDHINNAQRNPDPLEMTERKLANAESELLSVLKSNSWMISKPLRWSAAAFRRVVRQLSS